MTPGAGGGAATRTPLVRCVEALVSYLADVTFLLCIEHEDDDGHNSYLVDRYDITGGTLRWHRHQTPDDDLDAHLPVIP